jgi:hypothetical protein
MLKKIFFMRTAYLSLSCLILQQLIVAASPLAFVQLTNALDAKTNVTGALVLVSLNLLLPYFPGVAYFHLSQIWEQEAYGRFLNALKQRIASESSHWNAKEEKERTLSFFTKDGYAIIHQTLQKGLDLLSTGLNALLSILALAFLFSPLLLVGYAVSLALVAICLKQQDKVLFSKSETTENHKIALTSLLTNAWDNVVLGNQTNTGVYNRKLNQAFETQKNHVTSLSLYTELSSLGMAMLCLLPTFGVFLYLFLTHLDNNLFLIQLSISLPRLFQVLNSTTTLVYHINGWAAQRGRLKLLSDALTPLAKIDLRQRITWENITVASNNETQSWPSPDDFMAHLKTITSGRFTITGTNGAGKSTSLLHIKSHFKGDAYYLPSHHTLSFDSETESRSSGQKLMAVFKEIQADPAPLLLLDEWDANLDHLNTAELDKQIDKIALSKVVLEIRH